jgi:hypothetical protein
MTVSDVRVSPYRFTDHPVPTRALLEAVGLTPVVTREDFATLRGTGGVVGVHSLASATLVDRASTALVLEVDDARLTAEKLVAAGLEARWWDEAWGRQAAVLAPSGEVEITEVARDPYGYEIHDDAPRREVDVVAVLFTRDLEAWSQFFARLGFLGGDDPHWRPLRAGEGSGVIGLHAADDTTPEGACALALEVAEPLSDLGGRLSALGHAVEQRDDTLVVTAPDGMPIEVHGR